MKKHNKTLSLIINSETKQEVKKEKKLLENRRQKEKETIQLYTLVIY